MSAAAAGSVTEAPPEAAGEQTVGVVRRELAGVSRVACRAQPEVVSAAGGVIRAVEEYSLVVDTVRKPRSPPTDRRGGIDSRAGMDFEEIIDAARHAAGGVSHEARSVVRSTL